MQKTIKWIDENFEEFIMSYALWSVVVIMGLQVIMRYIFKSSLSWSEELARYFFIWFACLVVSHGVHADTHVKLDFVQSFFPKMSKPLEISGDLIFFMFILYMLKPGMNVLNHLINSKQPSPAIGIPMYIIYLSLFIGLSLSLLRLIQKYYKKFISKGDMK